MTRQEIIRFYENKIDDISDANIREQLLKELVTIEEQLISLDGKIDEEIEYQEDHIEDEIGYNYELYLRSVKQ